MLHTREICSVNWFSPFSTVPSMVKTDIFISLHNISSNNFYSIALYIYIYKIHKCINIYIYIYINIYMLYMYNYIYI